MRITPKGSPGIYKVLPETIKLEILKEDLIKIYKKEKELEESMINPIILKLFSMAETKL